MEERGLVIRAATRAVGFAPHGSERLGGMPKTATFPSFRSNKVKETKPRFMRADGWFEYMCASCGATVRFRKRQAHSDEVQCGQCGK